MLYLLLDMHSETGDQETPLRQILKRNRLSQKEVAAGMGASPEIVSAWVRGTRVPSGTSLVRLRAFLRKFDRKVTADLILSQVPLSDVTSPSD